MTASGSASATALRDRIAAGDRVALGEAFERFRGLALGVIRKQRIPAGSEDDIVQETFLQLPACARHCQSTTTIEGCVVTAAHQARRNYRTERSTSNMIGQGYNGRPARVVAISEGTMLSMADQGDDPEAALQARERAHHLAELLEQMPKRSRDLLVAREVKDMSTQEIADRFDMRPCSVSTMLGIARQRLVTLAKSSPIADVFAAMPAGRGAYRRSA